MSDKDISMRLYDAEIRAAEAHDYAGAHMLGDIREDWDAGRMPRANAEIALAAAARRAGGSRA